MTEERVYCNAQFAGKNSKGDDAIFFCEKKFKHVGLHGIPRKGIEGPEVPKEAPPEPEAAPDAQRDLIDHLEGFEGRWSAQPDDLVGSSGWVVADYPHPLSEIIRTGGSKEHRVIAECNSEYDAKYLALLLNAHESAIMVPGEIHHMLRLALVGERHEQYHMDAEFHAFVNLLVHVLPRLMAEHAAGDRPKVEARFKDFLAGIIQ